MKGGLLYKLSLELVGSRRSRCQYGVPTDPVFIEGTHLANRNYTTADGLEHRDALVSEPSAHPQLRSNDDTEF